MTTRLTFTLRMSRSGLEHLTERASDEGVLTRDGKPNTSEMARIMLAYAAASMPKGWRPAKPAVPELVLPTEVEVLVPATVAPYAGERGGNRQIYLHLLERCPAARRAVARDGEAVRRRMVGLAELRHQEHPVCAVCLRWFRASFGGRVPALNDPH